MGKRLDLTNKKFGRLTAVRPGPKQGKKNRWVCVCECGNTSMVETSSLCLGKVVSCGCYARERTSAVTRKRNLTHGKSKSRVYKIWFDMCRRCHDERVDGFLAYGAKGIFVCERWRSFENFLADMGEPQDGQSLDRIDNSKGYSPDNCRWADVYQQANNRSNNHRFEVNGEFLSIAEMSRKFGIKYTVLRARLTQYGWPVERAIV